MYGIHLLNDNRERASPGRAAHANGAVVGVARMRDFLYCADGSFRVPSARFHGDSGFSRGSLFYQESGERVGSEIPTPTWRIRQGGPAYSDEGGTYGRRMLYLFTVKEGE